MSRRLLLAGTRVTGPSPHLGTFYGWLRPVAAAAQTMDVCVLIADLQSLDVSRDGSLEDHTTQLVSAMRRYLPANVAIVRESAVPSLPLLGMYASTLFAGHHLRRVAPLRQLAARGRPIPVSTLLYPAMMIANVIAFNATHVLAKPEGRFQHHDVLNDVLHRAAKIYRWPHHRLAAQPKPRIDLPSGDGTGPMKRDRPGALTLTNADAGTVLRWAQQLPSPDTLHAGQRPAACRVVLPTWHAITHDQPERRTRVHRACATGVLDCHTCKTTLARAITTDLDAARRACVGEPTCPRLADQAEQRAQDLIARASASHLADPC